MTIPIVFHCYCTGITQKKVLRAMAAHGLAAVEEVRRATGACTGCQSCRRELEQLVSMVADGRIAVPAGTATGAPAGGALTAP